MPNPSLLRSLLILPPLCAGVFLNGCKPSAAGGAPPGGGFAVPVTASPAMAADVPIYLDEIGKATASQSVTILPQVSGPILKRDFEDGAELKKGQILFEIDPRPFQAALDQANGQLAKDTATQVSAAWNVQQDQAAMATKAISEQQLHNDIGTRDAAAGAILVDKAQIYTAQLNLDYCSIKSPIDGRAGLRLVDAGNVITAAGQAPGTSLLSIQTLDPIYADFTITEAELLKVQDYMKVAGQQANLKVEVQLPEDAAAMSGPQPATQPTALPPGADFSPNPTAPAVIGVPSPEQSGQTPSTQAAATQPAMLPVPRIGKLIFLDNAVQDGTGTVKLRALVPNSDHHFWPGQFVRVRLILSIQKDAVVIPNEAVQISQAGPFVYVVKSDGTAAAQPVTQGQRQGTNVVIEHGLDVGDQVVITGQQLLMPGAKVMVVNAPKGPGGPGAPAGGPPAGGPPAASENAKKGDGVSSASRSIVGEGSHS